jgi:hypothetical protein
VSAPGVVRTAMVVAVLESPELSRLLPGIPSAVAEGRDLPPERAAELVVRLASGIADGLSGRYLESTKFCGGPAPAPRGLVGGDSR